MNSKRIYMTFGGDNLQIIRCAVALAIEVVHMHIASCPDVEEYAEDIEMFEQDKQLFKDLLLRIDKKLEET